MGQACCQNADAAAGDAMVTVDQERVIEASQEESVQEAEERKERESAEAKRRADEEAETNRRAAEEPPPKEEPMPAPDPAPDPVPAAPPEPQKEEVGIPVTFNTGASIKTVTISRKPLGMIFGKQQPLTVTSVRKGSHCDNLGVLPGWVVKSVDGQDISKMSVEDAADLALSKMQGLPQSDGSVVLVFDANGAERTVVASRKPFGATLLKQAPLTISKVAPDGHADKLRVKPGWTLKSVAGEDLTKMDYESAAAAFEKAMNPLPQVEALEKGIMLIFDASGTERTVIATRRPLGATFLTQAPLTITKVAPDSHANKLGVEPGWTLKSVEKSDVSNLDYERAVQVFQRAMNSLPRMEA